MAEHTHTHTLRDDEWDAKREKKRKDDRIKAKDKMKKESRVDERVKVVIVINASEPPNERKREEGLPK